MIVEVPATPVFVVTDVGVALIVKSGKTTLRLVVPLLEECCVSPG